MLSRLHARGVRVGVVTRNSREAVRIAFEGIENVCDVFLPRDAVEHVKPHPLHLETCLSLLRVEPSRSLMVGDHPIDISSGRVLGMRTAGVLTGSGSEGALRMAGADFIFRDATGILSLFGYPSSNGGSE
jgi:phosphoglycolate phosphatase